MIKYPFREFVQRRGAKGHEFREGESLQSRDTVEK